MSNLREHSNHLASVLGGYCWVCRVKVQAGIPGWGKPSRSDHFPDLRDQSPKETRMNENSKYIGPNPYDNLTSIVWANGDTARAKDQTQCIDCEKHCGKPVGREFEWGEDPYRFRWISWMSRRAQQAL